MNEQSYPLQTAPIDEYRVLWTTQKKQKLKKWHDGFLRFHKFNKRMLVYDDARHLVADMYLRGSDAIGEGDDLEFEHHLVTVEDFKGTVVQDLAPLFSPAVQRKQQIQAGNVLLNSPTPNQANRHGPWGPNRHATLTPQSIQQRRPMVAANHPQTLAQRGSMDSLGLTLQQAAWKSSCQAPAQGRSSGLTQQLPQNAPASVTSTTGSLQKLSSVPRLSPPPIPHRSQRLNLAPGPVQTLTHSQQNLVPTTAQPIKRLPLYVPGGSLSPTRRPDPPPPASLQRSQLPSPKPNHAVSPPPPSCIGLRPSATTFDPGNNPDKVQLSPGISHAVSPQRSSPSARSKDAFSHPVSSRRNKRTPDVAFDIDSDSEPFGSPLDFEAFDSPLRPGTLPQRNSVSSNFATPRANKRSPSKARQFRPPTKRESGSTPVISQSRFLEAVAASTNKKGDTTSESREDSEKGPTYKSIVSAGVLRLNNPTNRKRNKLLCQKPLRNPTAASETKSARSAAPLVKNGLQISRTSSISKSPSLAIAENITVVDADCGPNGKSDTMEAPTVDRRKPNNTSRVSKEVGKSVVGRKNDKGNGKANNPGSKEDIQIHEEDDTPQYQEDNDIGPWSSERLICLVGDP